MSLTLVTAPTVEPVSVEEVKDHHKILQAAEDHLLLPFIKQAREFVENETGLKLISQTWDWRLDGFQALMRLPFAPVVSVTSISYTDTGGSTQTLVANTDYQVDTHSRPGRIMPAYGATWPSVRTQTFNAVTVRFVAGYANQVAVPKELRGAVLQIVGDIFNNRGEAFDFQMYSPPFGAKAAILNHRIDHFRTE